MNNVKRGCQCKDQCGIHPAQYNAKTAPVIKRVNRNGKDIDVCSRCDLSTDKLVKFYINEKSPFKPYFDYDPLIIGLMAKMEGLT